MAATAERFGTRPSLLLGIPPERDWLAYCVDEAIHVLSAGHSARDRRWEEAFRRDPGDYTSEDGVENLYDKIMGDPAAGRPPGAAAKAALEYAQEHGIMRDPA